MARDDDFESHRSLESEDERREIGKKEGRKEGRKEWREKKREAKTRRRCFEGGDCHSNRLEIIQRAPLGPGSVLENGPA